MDPDDYVKKFGRDGFKKLIDEAVPYVEYVLSVIAGKHDLTTNTGRARYVKEALDFIKPYNTAEKEVYLEIVHDKSRVPINILREGFENDISQVAFSEPERPKESLPVSLEAARFVLNKMVSGEDFARPDDVVSTSSATTRCTRRFTSISNKNTTRAKNRRRICFILCPGTRRLPPYSIP